MGDIYRCSVCNKNHPTYQMALDCKERHGSRGPGELRQSQPRYSAASRESSACDHCAERLLRDEKETQMGELKKDLKDKDKIIEDMKKQIDEMKATNHWLAIPGIKALVEARLAALSNPPGKEDEGLVVTFLNSQMGKSLGEGLGAAVQESAKKFFPTGLNPATAQRPAAPTPTVQRTVQWESLNEQQKIPALAAELRETFKDLEPEAIEIAARMAVTEVKGGAMNVVIDHAIEIIWIVMNAYKVVKGLRMIDAGIATEAEAAKHLHDNYPQESKVLLKIPAEDIFRRAEAFLAVPSARRDIEYLLQDATKQRMNNILAILRKLHAG